MMELAASYTASKDGSGVPCLLPVFFKLKPEHAKNYERQKEWLRTWEGWELNEIMSERIELRTNRVQPKGMEGCFRQALGYSWSNLQTT